jgi:PAS domain-containing protein
MLAMHGAIASATARDGGNTGNAWSDCQCDTSGEARQSTARDFAARTQTAAKRFKHKATWARLSVGVSLRETGAGKQANSRLKWEEDAAVAPMPEIYLPVSTAELSWRVLGFVNGLRLLASSALATLFVSIMPETIGQLDPALFAGAATAYFLYAVISIGAIRKRSPDIVLQTWTGVFADVLVLSLLNYASGGVNVGIAALVTLSVGATSFILRRRLAMSIALGASFAMLIQPAISLLADTDTVSDFSTAAVSAALMVIIGLGISQLARVLRQNEELVRQREADAGDLNDLHRSIAQHLREGVLVVDGENRITLISDPATMLIMGGDVLNGSRLDEVSPRLANLLETWRSYYCDESRSSPTMLGIDGARLQLKFVSLDGSSQGSALIFVDDKSRMPVWSPDSLVPATIQVNKMPVPGEPAPVVREVVRESLVSAGVSDGAFASAAQGREFEAPYAARAPKQRSLESPYAKAPRERPFDPSYSSGAPPRERQREPARPPREPAFEDSVFGAGLAAVSALRPSEPKQDPFRPDPFRDSGRRQKSLPRAESEDDFEPAVDRASSLRENLARQNSYRAALQEVSPWANPKPQPKPQPKSQSKAQPKPPVPALAAPPPPAPSAPPAPGRREPPKPASTMLTKDDPRLRIIIGNALQFARVDSARLERLDLASWTKEFVSEFWLTEEIDADTLRLNVPRENLPVRADAVHLHKLVWTLCSDLLKYGRASNATDPIEVRVGRSTKTQRRYLDIIDRGTAVGPADSKRVFEPFLNAGKVGPGIGIFVSRELSPGIGSGANNDPRPGGGVVFRLVFAEAPAPKAVEPVEE